MARAASAANFKMANLSVPAAARTRRLNHPSGFTDWDFTTLSMTTFNGHGCNRSVMVSPITARNPKTRDFQCGRNRSIFRCFNHPRGMRHLVNQAGQKFPPDVESNGYRHGRSEIRRSEERRVGKE